MRSLPHDRTVIKQQDQVGPPDRTDALGDDKGRPSSTKVVQCQLKLVLGLGVDR